MLERMLHAGINGALTSALFVVFIILPITFAKIILKKIHNKIKNTTSSKEDTSTQSKKFKDIPDKTYKILMTILIIIFIILVFVLVYNLYSNNQDTLDSLNSQINTLHDTISRKNQEISKLKQELESNNKQLNFMDNFIVIVPNNTSIYHKYGCKYLDLSGFLIFNIQNAKAQGYNACTHCIK